MMAFSPGRTEAKWYCTGLQIRDVHTESWILIFFHPGSQISDPGSNKKKEEGKKIVALPIL
jgi:hypothetical protein